MSGDGAQQGITADDALDVVLGNKSADDVAQRSTQEMAERIMARTFADADPELDGTYEGCAEYCAKLIFEWYVGDPKRVSAGDPYDEMKAAGFAVAELGVTGFQWGWALNAARAMLELPALPNPAIVTIGSES